EGSAARNSYRCRALRDGDSGGGHVRRNAPALDKYVTEECITELSTLDRFHLHARSVDPTVDLPALRTERKALLVQLDEFAEVKAQGLISRTQMLAGTKVVNDKLAEIDRILTRATRVSPVARLVSPVDPYDEEQRVSTADRWAQLSLGEQRAIIQEVMTVTVLPTTRRGKGFDPAYVRIEWKTGPA